MASLESSILLKGQDISGLNSQEIPGVEEETGTNETSVLAVSQSHLPAHKPPRDKLAVLALASMNLVFIKPLVPTLSSQTFHGDAPDV